MGCDEEVEKAVSRIAPVEECVQHRMRRCEPQNRVSGWVADAETRSRNSGGAEGGNRTQRIDLEFSIPIAA
jgi:hypothetical protein